MRRPRFRRAPVGKCCLCGRTRPLPHVTPADPSWLPETGGRHCRPCEHWIRTGESIDGVDLGSCAWYQRARGLPGHDPNGICSFGCVTEPACETMEPNDYWPSVRRALARRHKEITA